MHTERLPEAWTSGFTGRRLEPTAARRLPPGQRLEDGYPVLTAGLTQRVDVDVWRLDVNGAVGQPSSFTFADLQRLPSTTFRGDIHCVTGWTKLGVSFRGVVLDDLLERSEPSSSAKHLLVRSVGGYTTSIPLDEARRLGAIVAYEQDGRPIAGRHGGPVRFVVPERYYWKSAKWVTELVLSDELTLGFWESHGYHERGDPWLEERYSDVDAREDWKVARVVELRRMTPRSMSVLLQLPDPVDLVPGQHVRLRLTSADGYAAVRPYSVASRPNGDGLLELVVDRWPGGEVSEYLHDRCKVGDMVAILGPAGDYFTWNGEASVLLIAGGSGVVPLMSILRQQRALYPDVLARLIYSARSPDDLLFADELGPDTTIVLTRTGSTDDLARVGRIDAETLRPFLRPDQRIMVCGADAFVEAMTEILRSLGAPDDAIATERFGGDYPDDPGRQGP